MDAVRGKVQFSHFTNARIPWPKYKKESTQSGGGSGGFVLCGDLVRALKDESATAIAYHWGVCHGTIVNWRLVLDLKGRSPGSQRLVDIGVELACRPEGRAKQSLAMQGKVLSRTHKTHLFAAMKAGWKKRYKARRKAYRETGRFPPTTKSDPWIPEEIKLLATCPTDKLARIIKRAPQSIQAKRCSLGIRPPASAKRRSWEKSELAILGTDTDCVIAKRLKRSVMSVSRKRSELGIIGFTWRHHAPRSKG